MSVVIRMKRTGRRNRPCYRITVADRRWPRDGRSLETLGLYDPIARDQEKQVRLDVERARHWLAVGAQPSGTARSIFKRMGVHEGLATGPATGPAKKRDRAGRKRKTATKARRQELLAGRAARKDERRTARAAARRQAETAASEEQPAS